MAENLYDYRDSPFRLLQLLETRCREINQSFTGESEQREWVGIAFRIGKETFITSRGDVREILALLPVTRVPGAKDWLLGLANLRSQLMPVIDLTRFLGAGEHSVSGEERMIVVNHDKIPAALIVDEVLGFRRFSESELSADETTASEFDVAPYVLGACQRDAKRWSVLGLRKMVESPQFMQSSANH